LIAVVCIGSSPSGTAVIEVDICWIIERVEEVGNEERGNLSVFALCLFACNKRMTARCSSPSMDDKVTMTEFNKELDRIPMNMK
jgi:hypothetical protein